MTASDSHYDSMVGSTEPERQEAAIRWPRLNHGQLVALLGRRRVGPVAALAGLAYRLRAEMSDAGSEDDLESLRKRYQEAFYVARDRCRAAARTIAIMNASDDDGAPAALNAALSGGVDGIEEAEQRKRRYGSEMNVYHWIIADGVGPGQESIVFSEIMLRRLMSWPQKRRDEQWKGRVACRRMWIDASLEMIATVTG